MRSQDPLWYKDAVFYEIHVKAFQDSNADGMGDFSGLIQRLDYVQDLGVDVIWLLPFYPSPLRDDGYDIADYYGINPSYGTIDDFQRFLDESHKRGLRVIADLVLNHTSDQHPWFQRARRAPKGSPERDWYVWSDDDERYGEARIIFTDTEPSNWTWDPVAGQYYWHRFFAHQPDLNWDNPEVKEAMFGVMEYWLERGLDGFRADAVPYLIERDGTICENLPETHDILKEFRARLDGRYPDRILLAEANQWPEDVRPYFGDSDEFHMAFHFPLMPRIFMAVRQGIRKPIVEIIEKTPPIPDDCQWCMFLRNHDELTLEMVTDEERDYMYAEYAADPRMRINLGIRRRLAPLMDNDRRKIELLNSILFTMPGSPIIYYGDEIGMGDNIYLGDRDGVRTPMQWSPDRNAGFSRAEPQRLYLPVLTDSIYGFSGVNAEAQQRSPYSLLNWMKRLVQVRKQFHAFGRGSIEFLQPENQHVLAYLREYEGDAILVVNNLSGSAQAVRLDLTRFSGCTPVEMLGQTDFLPIEETPYSLTLGPYGFFWFRLRRTPVEGEAQGQVEPAEWAEQEAILYAEGMDAERVVAGLSTEWLREQRWFRGKARELVGIHAYDHAVLFAEAGPRILLLFLEARYADGEPELYFLPLTPRPPARDTAAAVQVYTDAGEVRLYPALLDRDAALSLLDGVGRELTLESAGGRLVGRRTEVFDRFDGAATPVRPVGGEQSNTSIVFGEGLILKVFRKLEVGENPEIELSRYLLEETEFRSLPALAGWMTYEGEAGESALAGLFEFVSGGRDAWEYTLQALDRFFAAAGRSAADPGSTAGREALRRMAGSYLPSVRALGGVTGELHAALASTSEDPRFSPEPITASDVGRWTEAFQRHVSGVLDDVGRRLESIPGAFPPAVLNDLGEVVRAAPDLRHRVEGLRALQLAGCVKTRYHGDFHLGQVLRLGEGDREWVLLDFEGEPARPLHERREKQSPLRDVAGMLRSFDYAIRVAFSKQEPRDLIQRATLESWAEAWLREVRVAYLAGYREATADVDVAPRDGAALEAALAVFELEKAVYELGYELNNRPAWMWVPVQGIRTIMGGFR
jgi:maltose alpha-D-glucosyltransferase / alpha-amylase